MSDILHMDKDYIAQIDFSKNSDTWDLDYRDSFEQLELENLKAPSFEEIDKILSQLVPSCELPLPAFSAKKIKGKKMYELARR
ncbi:MAG: hypothetical protein ACOZBL_05435 [Patescibacteria group bacterium]